MPVTLPISHICMPMPLPVSHTAMAVSLPIVDIFTLDIGWLIGPCLSVLEIIKLRLYCLESLIDVLTHFGTSDDKFTGRKDEQDDFW